jgi:hypothetical protein
MEHAKQSGKPFEEVNAIQKSAKNFLERYWWLILFNVYLNEQTPRGFKKTFSQWLRDHMRVKRVIKRVELI